MKDILLTPDGDLNVTERGDISLTDSARQAIRIRLLWFLREWRFAPQYGVPYYEDILVKNPNLEKIRRIIKAKVLSVDEVSGVKKITVEYDKPSRIARVFYEVVVNGELLRGEEEVNV